MVSVLGEGTGRVLLSLRLGLVLETNNPGLRMDGGHARVLRHVDEAQDTVVGILQITCIPYLTNQGSWRAPIEGVRVAAEVRSAGVGKRLFMWAIDRVRERKCYMVQLTSDRSRRDAIRFYESLGFRASHEGMKLQLSYAAYSDA